MALSLAAEETLTRHRVALHKAFSVAKSDDGTDTTPANYEKRLRQRMIDELRSHTDRADTSHRHHWERLEQHATPDDLAAMIEEAKGQGNDKEKRDKDQALEEKHGIQGMDGRLEAVEDHLSGNGDGRFGEAEGATQRAERQGNDDAPDPAEVSAKVARLLAAYRGRVLGI